MEKKIAINDASKVKEHIILKTKFSEDNKVTKRKARDGISTKDLTIVCGNPECKYKGVIHFTCIPGKYWEGNCPNCGGLNRVTMNAKNHTQLTSKDRRQLKRDQYQAAEKAQTEVLSGEA